VDVGLRCSTAIRGTRGEEIEAWMLTEEVR
jgi:hypothetical protein